MFIVVVLQTILRSINTRNLFISKDETPSRLSDSHRSIPFSVSVKPSTSQQAILQLPWCNWYNIFGLNIITDSERINFCAKSWKQASCVKTSIVWIALLLTTRSTQLLEYFVGIRIGAKSHSSWVRFLVDPPYQTPRVIVKSQRCDENWDRSLRRTLYDSWRDEKRFSR